MLCYLWKRKFTTTFEGGFSRISNTYISPYHTFIEDKTKKYLDPTNRRKRRASLISQAISSDCNTNYFSIPKLPISSYTNAFMCCTEAALQSMVYCIIRPLRFSQGNLQRQSVNFFQVSPPSSTVIIIWNFDNLLRRQTTNLQLTVSLMLLKGTWDNSEFVSRMKNLM